MYIKETETFPAVQWLRLRTSNVGGFGSIPGWGTKIPHAIWYSQKQTKTTRNKNKDYFLENNIEIYKHLVRQIKKREKNHKVPV